MGRTGEENAGWNKLICSLICVEFSRFYPFIMGWPHHCRRQLCLPCTNSPAINAHRHVAPVVILGYQMWVDKSKKRQSCLLSLTFLDPNQLEMTVTADFYYDTIRKCISKISDGKISEWECTFYKLQISNFS